MNITRRQWLVTGSLAALGLATLKIRGIGVPAEAAQVEIFPVSHSEAEWRRLLTPEQFAVLRQEGTERAFTSPLNSEHRRGTFACAACSQSLFSSATKFDSGTGWPSFYQPLPHAVLEQPDHSLMMERTAVRCRRCGGHLGHVFDDGPRPTGLRYCMNGVAMTFQPA